MCPFIPRVGVSSTVPDLVAKANEILSPWVTLVSRTIAWPGCEAQTFHSFSQADYVSVLALTADGHIPLVKQYRPAVERVTLELPGGIIDSAETPAQVAARELFEETGFRAVAAPLLLGNLMPDSGRLENRYWCFFVQAEQASDWHPEALIERALFTRAELRQAVLGGRIDHALHISLIGLAVMRGCFSWGDSL